MNYIRHLTAFYERLATDDRFTPGHVSLYLALFQCWNMNHFQNPFSVNRSQVLQLCKIGSNHTYYKAMNDLYNWGYIQYEPSFSPVKGSLIHLCIFAQVITEIDSNPEPQLCKNDIATSAKMHRYRCKNDIASCAKMHPSLNNININYKLEREKKSHTQNLKNEKTGIENQKNLFGDNITGKPKRKKVASKKEKANIPSSLDEVLSFFKQESYPELEARKFFNHFQSNGWKVGGKTPMKDWHAAARNWMLNTQKFNPPVKPSFRNLNNNNTKNYGEPL